MNDNIHLSNDMESVEIRAIPKVSVIVPVYNVEQYLPKCIDSILNQTFTDFELLLINDGSPDRSGVICDEYAVKDSRITVFHKVNGGVSSARNLGLDHARGEWITFIDSDDWIDSVFLFTMVDAIEKSNVQIVFHGYKVVNGDSISLKTIEINNKSLQVSNGTIGIVSDDFLGFIWTKFFKKDIIDSERIRFDVDISLSEDYVFTLSYCRFIDDILFVEDVGYNYVIHTNSLMQKFYSFDKLRYKNMKLLEYANGLKDDNSILLNRIHRQIFRDNISSLYFSYLKRSSLYTKYRCYLELNQNNLCLTRGRYFLFYLFVFLFRFKVVNFCFNKILR